MLGTDEYRVNREAARSLARHADTYQRGGLLVEVISLNSDDEEDRLPVRRPAGATVIRPLTQPLVRERLTECARFVRVHRTRDGEEIRPAPPPGSCVSAVFDRARWPGVKHLRAVVNHPVLLPDGSILSRPGFDPETELLLWIPKMLEVVVPDRATRDEACTAAATLLGVVCDFPFESPAHRAAWVAALLTPLAWWAFNGPAPHFLIDANVRSAVEDLCGRLDSRTLVQRLKHFKRRIINGLFLDKARTEHSAARWAAFPASEFRHGGNQAPSTPSSPPGSGDGLLGGEKGEEGEPVFPRTETLDDFKLMEREAIELYGGG